MSAELKNFQDFYDVYKQQAQTQKPELTDFNEGAINDVLAGTTATVAQELVRILLDRFKKTYFSSAEGDDLEFLAVDHFGDPFARPGAQFAVGVVTFTRPNNSFGNVLIDTGTIVKTSPDANGQSQLFAVLSPVTMTGTLINASVQATVAGVAGNVVANAINTIQTALTDSSIVVTNLLPTAGGAAEETDAEYRETIKQLIETLKGATAAAIKAKALTVPGIEKATAIEFIQPVINWNIGGMVTEGDYFLLPKARLYVADANGTASQALLDLVKAAVLTTRAAGVYVETLAAIALALDWTATISLNPSGPNYAELSVDPQPIIDTMIEYIQDLDIGSDFSRALARQHILDLWGPTGTNDLTNFSTSTPSGDVTAAENEKLVPDTVEIN